MNKTVIIHAIQEKILKQDSIDNEAVEECIRIIGFLNQLQFRLHRVDLDYETTIEIASIIDIFIEVSELLISTY